MAIKKISANLLANNAVTAASIAGGAISAADIADNSITAAKLSTSTFAIDSLTVNTSDLVVDTANNRVGIGVTSMSNKLVVGGTEAADTAYLRLQNTPATAATHKVAMEFWGNEGTTDNSTFNIGRIYGEFDGSNYSDSRLTLGSASGGGTFNDELHISNGKVGIGTSDPQTYLHVYGNNAETLRLEGNDEYTYLRWRGTVSATGTNLGYIGFAGDTGTAADLNIVNAQNGDMSFSVNNALQFKIDETTNGQSTACASFKASGTDGSTVEMLRSTQMGYGSSYQVVQLGQAGSGRNISLGYDTSTCTSGSFSGNGEIIIPNNRAILAPLADNSTFEGVIKMNSDNQIAIGGNYTCGGVLQVDYNSGTESFCIINPDIQNYPGVDVEGISPLVVRGAHNAHTMSGSWNRIATFQSYFPMICLASTYSTDAFYGWGADRGFGMRWYYSTSTNLTAGTNVMSITNAGVFTTASTKSFRIPHPIESKRDEGYDLIHVATEAPRPDLLYRGTVELVGGTATINLDTHSNMTEGTFILLNKNVQVFTTNETDWDNVKGSVSGNILTITCQNNSSTASISWLVIGERQDDAYTNGESCGEDGNFITEELNAEKQAELQGR